MKSLMTKMGSFLREEDGVTAIEYGLIATLIALAIIATLALVGTNLDAQFVKIKNALV